MHSNVRHWYAMHTMHMYVYVCTYKYKYMLYVAADGRPQQIYIHVRFEDTTDDRYMPTHTCLQYISAYHYGLLSNLLIEVDILIFNPASYSNAYLPLWIPMCTNASDMERRIWI